MSSSDNSSSFNTRPSLLARVRDAQDAEAWAQFVDTYGPLVYRYCRRKGLQDADSADVVQDVMSDVARTMRSFTYQPELGRFRDWLGTVTQRKLARFFEKKNRVTGGAGGDVAKEVLDELPAPTPDVIWTDEFNAQVLQVGLSRIQPHFEAHTWEAFKQTWLDNQPAKEVAERIGLPIDAVYVAKSRVLKRLQEEVLTIAEDISQFVPLQS